MLSQLKLAGTGLFLLVSCFLFPSSGFAQSQDPWVRFCDSTGLCGYKDLQGSIKVPAIYSNFISSPDTFYNIVSVSERTKQYYLLKSGKKVGIDSVYAFDWDYDCEQEGKIRFKDYKLNRVGFLDKNGLPIIPAMYNYATPFRNGVAQVGLGAILKCIDEFKDTIHCENYAWVGGRQILINDKNEVLVDSLNLGYSNINWYSLKVNMPNPDTNLYFTATGRYGITYSFIDYNKEFSKWFNCVFIPSLRNEGNIKDYLFEEVAIRIEGKGWVNQNKNVFLDQFPHALTLERFQTNRLKRISNAWTYFNQFIFDTPLFRKYYNNCGYQADRFPVYNVIVHYYKWRQPSIAPGNEKNLTSQLVLDYQEHFEFLRTEDGYRLISASFRK